jgi:iron complex outermembrane receptor protein
LPNNGATQTYTNNKQLFTPNITSMLATQYSHFFNSNSKIFARIEWRYLGKQYFDLANQLTQNSFNTLNARAGFFYKKIECTIWAENLTSTNYVDYAYNFGAAHLGAPRTYGLLLKTTF